MEKDFWKNKDIKEFTEEEWEAVCDGCGKCCYRKIIKGYFFWKKTLYTRIACDCLDLKTGKCKVYENRFMFEGDCTQLTKENLKDFYWLPETCAYRLLAEKKDLPSWHPLVSGNPDSVKESGIMIKNGISESDADDWFDYIIEKES